MITLVTILFVYQISNGLFWQSFYVLFCFKLGNMKLSQKKNTEVLCAELFFDPLK